MQRRFVICAVALLLGCPGPSRRIRIVDEDSGAPPRADVPLAAADTGGAGAPDVPFGLDAPPMIGRDAPSFGAPDVPMVRPEPDAGSRPPPPPLGELRCRDWAEQHTMSGARWGTALTDIVRHLPRSYGDTYYDADTVTYGHETSHGIHSHIRNYLNDTGETANGFYVMDNRACLVREPRMRKSDVAAYIPMSLRWTRYSLYITGSTSWDDRPLYIWDEWVAYTNGSEVGIDRARARLWDSGWRGVVDGTVEFTAYAMAVGMAAEVREPGYFEREPNFRAFLAWNARRAMRLFREGRVMTDFRWDDQDEYFERFRTDPSAAAMRDWMRRVLGDEVTDEILAPL